MKLETLHDLYLSELKDLYSAEDQIVKALPKMIENAESPDLRTALAQHLEETRGHVARLEQVFEMHGEEARKQKCKGMQGVLAEGDEMVGKDATPVASAWSIMRFRPMEQSAPMRSKWATSAQPQY
jgi:ferritin-like metal-binding protein YciE